MRPKDYKNKRKDLKERKREAMDGDFKSAKERKAVSNSFKKESRSLKRSEKQAVQKAIRDLGLF
jgi:hypothetical protein